MLGCFSDVIAVLVQGAEAWVQTASAMEPSSLGICLDGDESASQPAKKFPIFGLAWLGLQSHNKKNMSRNEMREAKEELEKDRFPSS